MTRFYIQICGVFYRLLYTRWYVSKAVCCSWKCYYFNKNNFGFVFLSIVYDTKIQKSGRIFKILRRVNIPSPHLVTSVSINVFALSVFFLA